MATSVRHANKVIEIRNPGADWDLSSSSDQGYGMLNDLSQGPKIHSIEFKPAATSDKCVITEGADTGPVIAYFKARPGTTVPEAPLIKYFHGERHKPYLDYSLGSFASGSSVIIIYE